MEEGTGGGEGVARRRGGEEEEEEEEDVRGGGGGRGEREGQWCCVLPQGRKTRRVGSKYVV